jgi:hypothetical protein
MKKTFLILLTIASTCSINAQEKTKQKEVGFTFSNLDNFGLSYKFGNSNSVWRINTLLVSGSETKRTDSNRETNSKSIGFTLKFGKEYRKQITEKLEFRYGADLSFGYNKNENDANDQHLIDDLYVTNNNSETVLYRPGANLIIGFNYLVSENIILGAELLPGFNYMSGTTTRTNSNFVETETDLSGFDYGLSSSSALLTLAYRF